MSNSHGLEYVVVKKIEGVISFSLDCSNPTNVQKKKKVKNGSYL